MRRKKIVMIVGGVLALILVAAVALPFLIDVDRFRPTIETQLANALGRQVRIGHLRLSLLRGDVSADQISIADDPAFGNAPFVEAQSLGVGIELVPLITSRAVHVRSLTLKQPQVRLLRSASGTWNFSTLGHAPAKPASPASTGSAPAGKSSPGQTDPGSNQTSAPEISVQQLKISNGRLLVGNARRQQTYDSLEVTAQNISYESAFPFQLQMRTPGGGQVKLEGTAGPVDRQDTAQTPVQAKISAKNVDLASTGFVDPAAGLGGLVDFDGTIHSDGKVAHSEGTARASKLRLVKNASPATQPVNINYASDYNLKSQTGTLTKGQLLTGKSAVGMSGTYDLKGESPTLHMKLNAPNIPVQDIEALLPALGITLPAGSSLQSGTVNGHFTAEGPADRLVTAGDIALSNAKLSGFSLGSQMRALSALSGLKAGSDTLIQTLSSQLHITPEGIRSDNLKLIVADIGTLTGAGTISSGNALNFKMMAQVASGGGLANLLGRNASRGLPFRVQGTTSRPVFVPDVGGMLAGSVPGVSQQPGSPGQNLGGILGGLLNKKKKQ
ncbi:MAG TPA: AsmA family protein [Terriglobales bacterium]|nr:AsmA family protein [Terriglobales bacterium]